MTDKIQKIKDWISKTQDGLMDANGNFENPSNEGAFHILSNLDYYIDSLQEEPVKRTPADIEAAMQEVEEKSRVFTEAHKGEDTDTILAQMRGKEPVSEDLEKIVEEIAEPTILNAYGTKELARRLRNTICGISISENLDEYINELSKQFPEVSFAKLSRIAVRVAKWQKENLWKPADGDDLPEIDREVIAILDYDFGHYKVVYAHRPFPDGWDGTNIDTGEKEHFEPEIYDKGGWNQPHILYWLDARLPYEEK